LPVQPRAPVICSLRSPLPAPQQQERARRHGGKGTGSGCGPRSPGSPAPPTLAESPRQLRRTLAGVSSCILPTAQHPQAPSCQLVPTSTQTARGTGRWVLPPPPPTPGLHRSHTSSLPPAAPSADAARGPPPSRGKTRGRSKQAALPGEPSPSLGTETPRRGPCRAAETATPRPPDTQLCARALGSAQPSRAWLPRACSGFSSGCCPQPSPQTPRPASPLREKPTRPTATAADGTFRPAGTPWPTAQPRLQRHPRPARGTPQHAFTGGRIPLGSARAGVTPGGIPGGSGGRSPGTAPTRWPCRAHADPMAGTPGLLARAVRAGLQPPSSSHLPINICE